MPRAEANGIELEYEVAGPEDGEPLLLIMGLGAQMTRWPSAFGENRPDDVPLDGEAER